MRSPPVPRLQPAKVFLVSRGISQRAAAQALGVSEMHLSRVLNGHARASDHLKEELASLLEMPVEALFYDSEPVRHLALAGSG